jgi:Family of unknown function (DUF6088)
MPQILSIFVANTPQMSIYQRIQKYAENRPGEIIVPDDFRGLDSDTGVRTALMRLVKAGNLERVAQGIYYSPKTDPVVGKVYPSMDVIAHKVADRDKALLVATGTTALNELGLSTQVPLRHVYLTNGAPRVLQIGKSAIRFKQAGPRNFSYKGKISGLVILALRELGQKNINDDLLHRIASLLKKEQPKHLTHDIAKAPRWIADILKNLSKKDA